MLDAERIVREELGEMERGDEDVDLHADWVPTTIISWEVRRLGTPQGEIVALVELLDDYEGEGEHTYRRRGWHLDAHAGPAFLSERTAASWGEFRRILGLG